MFLFCGLSCCGGVAMFLFCGLLCCGGVAMFLCCGLLWLCGQAMLWIVVAAWPGYVVDCSGCMASLGCGLL